MAHRGRRDRQSREFHGRAESRLPPSKSPRGLRAARLLRPPRQRHHEPCTAGRRARANDLSAAGAFSETNRYDTVPFARSSCWRQYSLHPHPGGRNLRPGKRLGTVTLSLNGRCRTADRDQKVMRKGLHLSRCSKRSTLRFVHDAFHLQAVDPGDDETGWRSDRGWREISEHAALF